jgi:hypothetical protein
MTETEGPRVVTLTPRRRRGVPERVDQRVEADHPAAGQQQRGQRVLGLRTAHRDPLPAAADLDRPSEEELHARSEAPIRSAPVDRDRTDDES